MENGRKNRESHHFIFTTELISGLLGSLNLGHV